MRGQKVPAVVCIPFVSMTKPVDIVSEFAKQVITLASAGVALVATFREKFFANGSVPCALKVFFIASIISILLAILTLLTLAGGIQKSNNNFDIYSEPLRFIVFAAFFSYFLSILCLSLTVFSIF